jgi:UDP:flavonoid glycosyltransferase YjiC (YdhE family)
MARLLLGAFGDPGHAFPMIALGRALAARGHDVTLQTWRRWEEHVLAEGMAFAAAPEDPVFPTPGTPLNPYDAALPLTRRTLPLVERLAPDAVVADVLTLAPALAGELCDVPVATLIPHVHPALPPGCPPYSIGARRPRTALGRALWRAPGGVMERGLRTGRDDLNRLRRALGLAPVARLWGGLSEELCLVATFPQLEYPRTWPAGTHVVGPLLWEPPFQEDAEPPPGDEPLVLVAPSTTQDPSHRLLRSAIEGLADVPVRVLATTNRRPLDAPLELPANARLVDWLSYARTMARCDVVVCHAGHGTLARALASGCVAVAVPAAGDMAENAARVDWAGVGVRVPRRLCTPRAIRLAVGRALVRPGLRRRARGLAAWASAHDGAATAAVAVERFVGEVRGPAGRSTGLPGPGSGCPGNLAR